jgi:hypothetical protein
MFSVFLSYKRNADDRRAAIVREKLEALGVRVFQDIDMSAGAAVYPILDAQLKSAAAVVVLWTSASIRSRFVTAEAAKGLDRDVLVATVFDQLVPRDLQLPFNAVNTPDLSDWIETGALSSHRGWRSVLAALAALLGLPLLALADTLADGGWTAKTKFLQTYPQDAFAKKFASELMLMRRGELKELVATIQEDISSRARSALLKLGNFGGRLEEQLESFVHAGKDFQEFDSRMLAESFLSSASDAEASGLLSPVDKSGACENNITDPSSRSPEPAKAAASEIGTSAHHFVLRIFYEKPGLDPIVLPFSPGPFIDAQLLGARGAVLGKGALGVIETDPSTPGVWGIRNKSKQSWRVMARGQLHELAVGEAEWLAAGDIIDFGGGVTGVVEPK